MTKARVQHLDDQRDINENLSVLSAIRYLVANKNKTNYNVLRTITSWSQTPTIADVNIALRVDGR